MAKKSRKQSAAKATKKPAAAAKKKSKTVAKKKSKAVAKRKAARKAKPKSKPIAMRKGVLAQIAGAAKAVVDTLTDAEQMHHKMEPHVSREPE